MDNGLHFDHKNQTVTIRAHYYTTTNDLSSAQQATDFWNNQSGNYTYTMGSGNDAITYEVNFELMAIEVDNPLAYFQNDSSGEANVFATVGDNDSRFAPDTSGSTFGDNQILVKLEAMLTQSLTCLLVCIMIGGHNGEVNIPCAPAGLDIIFQEFKGNRTGTN